MAYTIYLRTNLINGMMYVGQTNDFNKRQSDWRCFKITYGNNFLDEERKLYGLLHFDVSILNKCETQEEAWELEQKYIKEYNTIYPNGYNMSEGGDMLHKWHLSEATRKRLKAVNQYDLNGNFIRRWDSAKEAARTLGIDSRRIYNCCKGVRFHKGKWEKCKTAYNSIWKYADKE